MKRLAKNIGKAIMAYIIFIILINAICALIMAQFFGSPFLETAGLLLCDQLYMQKQGLAVILIALKRVMEGIALAILASFVFTYIVNREIRIIFPDKIVLRRRTSEGSNGKLTLGILIGNPNKRILYDIKCSVNCIYLKNEGDIVQINSETYLSEEVDHITNYFRFSFEIEGFPKTFWKHFLEKSEKYLDNDLLQVIVTGKANGLGGYFRTDRRYGLQDIIVDTHEPEKRFKKKVKNMISLKEKYRIDWKEFPKCIEAGEPERRDIINEIQNYCCLPPN